MKNINFLLEHINKINIEKSKQNRSDYISKGLVREIIKRISHEDIKEKEIKQVIEYTNSLFSPWYGMNDIEYKFAFFHGLEYVKEGKINKIIELNLEAKELMEGE